MLVKGFLKIFLFFFSRRGGVYLPSAVSQVAALPAIYADLIVGSADFQRLSFGVDAERVVDVVGSVLKPYAAGAVVAGYCHIGVKQFGGLNSVVCDLPARLVGDDVPVFKGQTFAVLQATECVDDVLFHWRFLSFLL